MHVTSNIYLQHYWDTVHTGGWTCRLIQQMTTATPLCGQRIIPQKGLKQMREAALPSGGGERGRPSHLSRLQRAPGAA